MEFGEEERYACAALFTLALHMSQADHSSDLVIEDEDGRAWGQTEAEVQDASPSGEAQEQTADMATAEWLAFWGWDCCGPGGILDRMYQALQIPGKSWSALKRLPEIGGLSPAHRRRYLRLVSSYIKVLDEDLPALHFAAEQPVKDVEPAEVAERDLALAAGELLGQESGESVEMRQLPKDAAELLEALTSDTDSDLEHDLASVHLKERIVRHSSGTGARHDRRPSEAEEPHQQGMSSGARTGEGAGILASASSAVPCGERGADGKPPASQDSTLPRSSDLEEALPDQAAEPEGGEAAEGEGTEGGLEGPKKSYSRAEALSRAMLSWRDPDGEAPPSEAPDEAGAQEPSNPRQISGKALAAVWEILEACIRKDECVEDGGVVGAASERKGAVASGEAIEAGGQDDPEEKVEEFETPARTTVGGMAPAARWYDSRQRTSLKVVAAWLHVPWDRVAGFECLLVYQLMLPGDEGEGGRKGAQMTPWERSMRAAKIGAATLAVGGVFALTGGLAAPAIAAGLGAAVGLAGGSAAGLTGFLATTAGGAVVASAVGLGGSGLAAPHIARRIGLVKELGFWALERGQLDQSAEENPVIEEPMPAEAQTSGGKPDNLPAAEARSEGEGHSSAGTEKQVGTTSFGWLTGGAFRWRAPPKDGSGSAPAEVELAEQSPKPGNIGSSGDGEARPVPGLAKNASPLVSKPAEHDSGHLLITAPAASSHLAPPVEVSEVRRPTLETGKDGAGTAKGRRSIDGDKGTSAADASPPPAQDLHWWARWRSEVKEAPLLPTPVSPKRRVEDMRMSLTIGVCGWISGRQDFLSQWSDLTTCQNSSEAFTLVWESKELIELNNAIVAFAASQAGQEAAKWVLTHFFFTGLVAALAWPAVIYQAVQLIDTAWSVALHRAQGAGRLLAHILAAGGHGDRPVILVGNSMGARLIFHCLLELARLKAKGIVEHVCLLGTPVALRQERWALARSVVSGRLINGFSRKDWLLGVVYRGTAGFIKDAAGLGPVPFTGVENVNLTGLIQGHFEYIDKVGEIVELIGLYE